MRSNVFPSISRYVLKMPLNVFAPLISVQICNFQFGAKFKLEELGVCFQ